MTDKKYKLEELKIGMRVTPEQLSEIYDTWIFLIKDNKEDLGEIAFIGKEPNADSDKLFKRKGYITPIYNDSNEDCYEE